MKRTKNLKDGRAGIVIVGTPPATDRVHRALRPLHQSVSTVTDVEAATYEFHSNLTAIVIAGFGFRGGLRDAVTRLSTYARTHDVPMVVLIGAGYQRAQELYRLGASALFSWPSEALLLSRTLDTMSRTTERAGYPTAVDDALARSVEARLESVMPDYVPHVSAHDFDITLTGVVRSLSERMAIEEHLEVVPGVRKIDLSGVLLDVDITSDVSLGRRARAELTGGAGVDMRTLGVTARGGRVVLAGTVRDLDELERVLDVVANVRGVRGIDNHVTVCRSQRVDDLQRADRAEAIVNDVIVDNDAVHVSVMGPVAILTGRSIDRVPIHYLEQRLGDELGLERVVDAIDVRV